MMTTAELYLPVELREAFPVRHELRPQLSETQYLALLSQMVSQEYHLFAVRDAGTVGVEESPDDFSSQIKFLNSCYF